MPCSSFQIDRKADFFQYPQLYKSTTPLVRALHLVLAGPLSTPTTGSETVAAVGRSVPWWTNTWATHRRQCPRDLRDDNNPGFCYLPRGFMFRNRVK